jgi:hypothetical protein
MLPKNDEKKEKMDGRRICSIIICVPFPNIIFINPLPFQPSTPQPGSV